MADFSISSIAFKLNRISRPRQIGFNIPDLSRRFIVATEQLHRLARQARVRSASLSLCDLIFSLTETELYFILRCYITFKGICQY